MTEDKNKLNAEQLKDFIIHLLEEKKADDIVTIVLGERVQLAKYMVFASGRSTKNISAIADYIAFELKHKTLNNLHIEGMGKSEWVLLDVGDVVVHIFHPEARRFFNLENRWEDIKKIDIE